MTQSLEQAMLKIFELFGSWLSLGTKDTGAIQINADLEGDYAPELYLGDNSSRL